MTRAEQKKRLIKEILDLIHKPYTNKSSLYLHVVTGLKTMTHAQLSGLHTMITFNVRKEKIKNDNRSMSFVSH